LAPISSRKRRYTIVHTANRLVTTTKPTNELRTSAKTRKM
jgi:hypothetical protein